jgi:[ribosomal protein S5]-alanine N-acetyltransferase
MKHIQTKRLTLHNCDLPTTQAVLAGDAALAAHLHVQVKPNWSEFGAPAFEFTKTALEADPNQSEWLAYLPILKAENVLIGSCGYTGAPKDGVVEFGYEISAAYRSQGFATELAQALVRNALYKKGIKMVIAHTLAEENHSTRILKRCGLKRTGEFMHPEDGLVWRWELRRRWWHGWV